MFYGSGGIQNRVFQEAATKTRPAGRIQSRLRCFASPQTGATIATMMQATG
jgi:hypothetical protein